MASCGRRRSRHLPAAILSSMLGILAALPYLRGSARWRVTQRIEIDGFRIYVLHILAELNPTTSTR